MAAVEKHQIRLADLRVVAVRRADVDRIQRKRQLQILRKIARRLALQLIARVQMPNECFQLTRKVLHRINGTVIAHVKQRQKLLLGSLPLHVHQFRF